MPRRPPFAPFPSAFVLLVVLLAGCRSEATKKCHTLMTSAQDVVKNVDSKDIGSVEASLAAVDAAFSACVTAGRTGEADELQKAKNQFSGQATYLRKRASEPPRRKVSPAELAEMVKHGDPSCPKGQAYRPAELAKEIRCSGPQPADMGWKKAEEYFSGRGYKLTTADSPPTLKAEYGAELLVYTYGALKDEGPPKCLAVYPPPGMSWQEAAARVTGVPPQKLDKATTVRTDRGTLPLRVEDSETKVLVRIGECGS